MGSKFSGQNYFFISVESIIFVENEFRYLNYKAALVVVDLNLIMITCIYLYLVILRI